MANFSVSVWFDNNDISAIGGLFIPNHDFNQLPNREIKINKIARADLSLITSAEYTSKEIIVYAYAEQCTRYEAEAIVALTKSRVQLQNKILKVVQYDTTVEYTATMTGFKSTFNAGKVDMEITFTASDPIGRDVTEQMIELTTITDDLMAVPFTVGGSYKVFPVIRVVIIDVTDGTGESITLSNTTTSQAITITHDWAVDDELIVDNNAKTVRINGGFIDYEGSFLDFYPGGRSLGYADTFTDREVEVSGLYNKKYV